jgi:hypothetical protein
VRIVAAAAYSGLEARLPGAVARRVHDMETLLIAHPGSDPVGVEPPGDDVGSPDELAPTLRSDELRSRCGGDTIPCPPPDGCEPDDPHRGPARVCRGVTSAWGWRSMRWDPVER